MPNRKVCRRSLALSVTALFVALLSGTACVPHRLLELTNTLDEPIDAFSYSNRDSSVTRDTLEHLRALNIGDRTYLLCHEACMLEPNTSDWGEYVVGKPSVTIAARSRSSLQLVYYRVFSWRELKARDFKVEIVDMREPGAHLTGKPLDDRTSTLRCPECEVIDFRYGPKYGGETGTRGGRPIYFIPFTSYATLSRTRSYGARFPEPGQRCFQEGAYLENVLLVEEQSSREEMRHEPVPGADDGSGFPAFYLFSYRGGKSIDEVLIRNGVAYASGPDGQHWDHLKAVEEQARAAGTGCLWQD
jgi:hypothetical protein